MKGLLIKDVKLLLEQKKSIVMLMIVGIGMTVLTNNVYVGMGYLIIRLTLMATNTFHYDEADNGMAFLMTLSVTRKIYVKEKYYFAGGMAVLATILAWVLCIAGKQVFHAFPETSGLFFSGMVVMFFAWCMMAVNLPILIQFGAERGNLIVSVMMTAFFVCMCAVVANNSGILFVASQLTEIQMVSCVMCFTIVFLFFSYLLCVHLIKKKEY